MICGTRSTVDRKRCMHVHAFSIVFLCFIYYDSWYIVGSIAHRTRVGARMTMLYAHFPVPTPTCTTGTSPNVIPFSYDVDPHLSKELLSLIPNR